MGLAHIQAPNRPESSRIRRLHLRQVPRHVAGLEGLEAHALMGFGIRSARWLCEEPHLNLAYRWWCRLSLEEQVQMTVSPILQGHGCLPR
ncbi:hypothetical protein GIW50_08840 [Pseudomonas syringae]|uniref:Uncharacterized protein n=1 Tax=Pseudomonas syringae TaxID=317 RepID=A0A9Q3ZYB4_PSESX|nr:hypothetical protein [Pseudomonas syringae]MCF5062577.1 hypothetical protein [Pseudomonas syringae]MCF5075982.1 hypothetical protein [Pseudomonas syringae]MCF5118505.1 hypothetical protein [Pseudomonas syringae]MCF5379304.1 hypothetical protein [Pseudomonas syringae]